MADAPQTLEPQFNVRQHLQAQVDVSSWLLMNGFNFTTNRSLGDPPGRIWVLSFAASQDAPLTHLALHVIGTIFAVSSQLEIREPARGYADALMFLTQTVPYVKIVPDVDERHIVARAEFPIGSAGQFSIAFDTVAAALNSVYSAVQLLIEKYGDRFVRSKPEKEMMLPVLAREVGHPPSSSDLTPGPSEAR